MVADLIKAKFKAIAGAIAATSTIFIASPALANSSSNADIAAPLRTAQAAKPATMGTGDENFRTLFNNWQSFEETGVPALAAVADAADQANLTASARASRMAQATTGIWNRSVSIPSRMPVEGIQLTSAFGMRTPVNRLRHRARLTLLRPLTSLPRCNNHLTAGIPRVRTEFPRSHSDPATLLGGAGLRDPPAL